MNHQPANPIDPEKSYATLSVAQHVGTTVEEIEARIARGEIAARHDGRRHFVSGVELLRLMQG